VHGPLDEGHLEAPGHLRVERVLLVETADTRRRPSPSRRSEKPRCGSMMKGVAAGILSTGNGAVHTGEQSIGHRAAR
jgi:hypothetical protein